MTSKSVRTQVSFPDVPAEARGPDLRLGLRARVENGQIFLPRRLYPRFKDKTIGPVDPSRPGGNSSTISPGDSSITGLGFRYERPEVRPGAQSIQVGGTPTPRVICFSAREVRGMMRDLRKETEYLPEKTRSSESARPSDLVAEKRRKPLTDKKARPPSEGARRFSLLL
jgi:hypothetical protein